MIQKQTIHKTDVAYIILLVILAIILISPALIHSNKLLCPADSLNQWYPYKFINPAYDIPPKNDLLVDQVLQFIPWKMYTQYWMSQGVIPLWNHHQYCGAPFVGNSQSAIFSPINLATVFFDIRWNLILSALLKLWIAGTGMYIFLRRIKLEPGSAFFGGLGFMFCGFNVLWLGHPHTNIFVWLPWLLFVTENVFLSSSWRDIGILGILIGVALLGGHPETEFLVLLVWGLYAGYRIFTSNYEETNSSRILNLAVALLLGVVIASIQWLPSMEYITHSSAYQQRISGGTMEDYQAKRAIFTWLFPNIFGHPLLHNFWVKNELIYQFNYNEAVSNYIGVITVLLAVVGIIYRDRLPYSRIFIGLGIFAAVISYRVPIIGPVLSKIPPISLIHPKRMIIITSFALIVLAAQGMNTLLSINRKKEDIKLLRSYLSVLWVMVLCVTLISLSIKLIDMGFHSISRLPLQEYGPMVIAALQQGSLWIILSLAILTITIFTRWNPRIKVSLIIIILAADLLSFGWNYNPVVPARYLFPSNNPVANSIKVDRSQFRIISMNEWTVYPPNTAMADGLEDVRGYDAVVPARYEQFFQMAGLGFWKDSGPRIWQTDTTGEERALRVLNFLNVKYLLSEKELPTQKLVLLKLVKEWKDSYRYLNPGVQSRVFICRNIEYSVSPKEILMKLQQPGFNLQGKLMVEGYHHPISIDSVYSGESVTVEYPNPNKMVLKVKMIKDGMVCIAENYDPGWSGTLNGKTIKPVRAQYAFMAVALPAGDYQFTLHYRPRSFYFGVFFSLIGLGIALFLAVYRENSLSQGIQPDSMA